MATSGQDSPVAHATAAGRRLLLVGAWLLYMDERANEPQIC